MTVVVGRGQPVPHARQRLRRSALSVEAVVAGYCVVTLCLGLMLPQLRYLTYGIPFLCLIALLAAGRVSAPPNAAPYFILIVAGIALAPLGSLKGLQDCWLMLMGLMPFVFRFRYPIGWRGVFSAAVVITIVSIGIATASGRSSGFIFNLAKSSSTFESSTSFLFGILAVWALLERRFGRMLLALLLAVLTLKRIVIVATVVVLIVVLLPRRLTNLLLRPLPMIVLNGLFVAASIAYATGGLDELIRFYTDQSPNQFGMGRRFLYEGPVRELLKKPLDFAFYGSGAGGIYDMLRASGSVLVTQRNLHNDSLKILIEYGGIVWTCVFASMYWSKSFAVRAMMLFTNILWLTDNTLIYPFVISATALSLLAMTRPDGDDGDRPAQARTTRRTVSPDGSNRVPMRPSP